MRKFIGQLDNFYLWVARLMPRRLLYWCFIEGGTIATTGEYATTEVTELLYMDALKRVGIDKSQVVSSPEDLEIIHQQRREQGRCWQCNQLMVIEMLDCLNCGAAYDGSRSHARQLFEASWLDPTPEMLQSPESQAVWRAIQDCDISASLTPNGSLRSDR